MATVIDALVVTLGLDPRQYNEESRKSRETRRKLSDEDAAFSKAEIDRSNKRAQAINGVRREVLGLVTTIMGSASMVGFVARTVNVNASVGRLSQTLGVSTQALSAWQGAVKANGGTMEGATSSIQSLVGAFQQIQLTGQSPLIPYLQLLGISLKDLEDPSETLLKIADQFSKMDPRRAATLGAAMGLDPAMVSLLIQGRGEVERTLEAQRRAGVVTEEQARRAREAQKQWQELQQTFGFLGAEIATDVLPTLNQLGRWLTDVAQSNPAAVKGVMALAAALLSLRTAGLAVNLVFGGPILKKLLGLGAAEAAGAAGGAAGGGAALAAVGAVAPWLAGAIALFKPTVANKGEQEWIDARNKARAAGSATDQALAMIKAHEGFAANAKWDVNAYRAGYGSDTLTDPKTGAVTRVTAGTTGVTKEMADADLKRRISQEFMPRVARSVGAAWQGLSDATKAALTSVAYNYGTLPSSVAQAARTGEQEAIARAVAALGNNAGINNPERRLQEAQAILRSQGLNAPVTPGAKGAAGGNSSTVTIGQVTVNTQATDGPGIARDLDGAIRRRAMAAQSNSGVVG